MVETKNIEVLLQRSYRRYNKRSLVDPDPLIFLYNYPELKDREIVGLIASALAYGRVAQILKSVSSVLDVMGASPYDFLMSASICRQTIAHWFSFTVRRAACPA